MKFYGSDGRKRMEARSRARWEDWCRSHAGQPELQAFAERWADQMELLAQRDRAHVRGMALATLSATRGEKLTDAQVREVILILCLVWYLGDSLSLWAVRKGILGPTEGLRGY